MNRKQIEQALLDCRYSLTNIDVINKIDSIRIGLQSGPKIVCFCGSSRFIAQMAILMWEWEKAGHIAMGLHYLPAEYCKRYPSDPDGSVHHIPEHEGIAEKMDELHKRKIDLADEIFVVNVGSYIGTSTRSEIDYAIAHGKPVRYLEPIS